MRQLAWIMGLWAAGVGVAWSGGFGLGVSGGTLGVGIQASYGLTEHIALRGMLAGIDISVDFESDGDSDFEYDGDAELRTALALVDYHPFAGSFRVTGGLAFGDSEIEGTATCDETTCDFGDSSGLLVQGDRVRANADFGGTRPYLGVGWGSAPGEESGWAFSADLGAYFLNDPDVDVRISGPSVQNPVTAPIVKAEAAEEEDNIEDDLDSFSLYPVAMFGVSYTF